MKNRKLSVEKLGFASFLECSKPLAGMMASYTRTHGKLSTSSSSSPAPALVSEYPYPSSAIGARLCVLYIMCCFQFQFRWMLDMLTFISFFLSFFLICLLFFLPPLCTKKYNIPKPHSMVQFGCVNFCCCCCCQVAAEKTESIWNIKTDLSSWI